MKLCDYGCGQEATHQFKNGKFCCSKNISLCENTKKKISNKNTGNKHSEEAIRKMIDCKVGKKNPRFGVKLSENTKIKIGNGNKGKIVSIKSRMKQSIIHKGKKYRMGKKHSDETKEKLRNISLKRKTNPMLGKKHSDKTKRLIGKKSKLNLNKIRKKYPLFYKIEEIRENPNTGKIQVHCKNHNCSNSKEKGEWFTPGKYQLSDRIRALESQNGSDGCYFYCSDKCKQTCPLYNLKSDPFKEIIKPYTQEEYNLWKKIVLKQDDYECQKCGSKENLHCHHIIPVKIEPIFSLDPDNGIVLCKDCHYEYGHKIGTECSTGNLANKICI